MADVTIDDIAAALAAVNDAFQSAPAESGSIYDPPPDGEYQALIHEFSFIGWEAKNGKPAGMGLKINYQVTNHATYAGRICGDMMGLAPDRIGYLKGWLAMMGVDVENLDLRDLRPTPGSVLDRLLDTPVAIRVKRNGQYTNVYLLEKLGAPVSRSDVTPQTALDEFPTAVGRGATNDDDDIPF